MAAEDPDGPMVAAPIQGLELIDDKPHQYLASCEIGCRVVESQEVIRKRRKPWH
jgi:hypothetical protein